MIPCRSYFLGVWSLIIDTMSQWWNEAVNKWSIPSQRRHNKRDGVSNHGRLDCLSNLLFRFISKKTQSSASLAFVSGIHRWPVNSPHKGPVTRKMFLFDDIIVRKALMSHPHVIISDKTDWPPRNFRFPVDAKGPETWSSQECYCVLHHLGWMAWLVIW